MKKPFWKRPLGVVLIAIAVILVIGIINAITGDGETEDQPAPQETTQDQADVAELDLFDLDDETGDLEKYVGETIQTRGLVMHADDDLLMVTSQLDEDSHTSVACHTDVDQDLYEFGVYATVQGEVTSVSDSMLEIDNCATTQE